MATFSTIEDLKDQPVNIGPVHTGDSVSVLTVIGICANAAMACLALALLPWRGTGRHRATRSDPARIEASADAPDIDHDTVQIPRLPVAKLLDPDTETTLSTPLPRQRTGPVMSEGTLR
ncbi:hypothetical protein [Streptomyces cylindrosporus]|uniref:Uncharacterized protein n=1 Tax=Streptomyces cylindrosporus TaxID=2927583 RepID=A0ABS9YLR1_9ACTN|nr:hypothetical protein [Streptomyces cylindrosporus]MCI3277481.1 hypothetical protein [Streptomyces cylindrosporus]